MVKPIPETGEQARDLQQPSTVEAVCLTCFDTEFAFLATVLQYSRIRLHRADTLEKADFILTVSGSTVLISDLVFLDGDWRDAFRMVADLHPLVGTIVAVDPLDWPLVSDLYQLGGCGVLWKPVDFIRAIDFIRTVGQAAWDRTLLRHSLSVCPHPDPDLRTITPHRPGGPA
jgi:hypothetical protein